MYSIYAGTDEASQGRSKRSTPKSAYRRAHKVLKIHPDPTCQGQPMQHECSTQPQNSSDTENLSDELDEHNTNLPSPDVLVSVNHNSGAKHYKMTPTRKVLAKCVARRSYPALCGSLVKSHNDHVIKHLSITARKELSHICSIKRNSLLRDGYDRMKQFSWDMLWLEYVHNLPTLVSLISAISPTSSIAVRCTIISIIVKQRHNKMALLQRIISMFFYGNSVNKQVYRCLQPLNLCLSHKAMLNTVDLAAKRFDEIPLAWRDNLVAYIKDNSDGNISTCNSIGLEDTCSQSGDELSIYSFDAPSFSPVTTDTSCCSSSSGTSPVDNDSVLCDKEPELDRRLRINLEVEDDLQHLSSTPKSWTGFKLVIDNLDKNFRLSFQHCDKGTESMNICHVYALKDRINFSSYNGDDPVAAPIDVIKLLINIDDLQQVKSDAIILFSRILAQHLKEYNTQAKDVPSQIESQFPNEMCTASGVSRRTGVLRTVRKMSCIF